MWTIAALRGGAGASGTAVSEGDGKREFGRDKILVLFDIDGTLTGRHAV